MNIKLVCKAVRYFAAVDEDYFFEWIERIPSIVKVGGAGRELYLYVKNTTIPSSDLREIITLFRRYRINTDQLAVFINEDNPLWLSKELLMGHRNAQKSKLSIQITGLLPAPNNK